ncbi:MAG: hypothetical protein Q7J98_02145 [Kiritimatiellia bacterium]|nr:hypothetical protein [Kiritimatiellia bacterium]
MYSTILGSVTPLPASLFTSDEIYFEIAINGETLTPRQRVTASPFALTARTVSGPDIHVDSNGKVGIGTQTPEEKLDVKGTIQATGFKMPTGASAGYILTSDESGVGQWQAGSIVTTEHDPVHTNWVRVVFAPATNALWNAVNARALAADLGAATNDLWAAVDARVLAATYNVATGNLWTAVGDRVLIANYSTATNELWNAVNARLPRAGGVMTGPLTNNSGFFGSFVGDGAGITNISSTNFVSGAVLKTGDTMTGPLVINSDLTVSGKTIWSPGAQTIANNNTTIQVAQVFAKIGTDGVLRDFSGCALQIAPGAPGQSLIIQTTNSSVKLNDGQGVKLAGGVNFYMSTNDTIQLIYDGSTWIELQRMDKDD